MNLYNARSLFSKFPLHPKLTPQFVRGCLLLGLSIWLAACQLNNTVPTAPAPTAIPTTSLPLADAQRVAADFLNAWQAGNYPAMYDLLTLNSRDAYSQAEFEGQYAATEKKMALLPEGKQYSLASAIIRGDTAEIAYDMLFKSQLFGEFTDPNRLLLLVATSDGWRISWTPGNIIAEFKEDGYLDTVETTPNRGNIYDRDGQVIVDQNNLVVIVNLRTQQYPSEPDACFQELARVFPKRSFEQIKDIYQRFTGQDYKFVVGEMNPAYFQAERAALEKVCTLEYGNRPVRRYVEGGLAPHVVGYVGPIPAEQLDDYLAKGYSPDAMVGIDGVERFWEDTLAGRGEVRLNVMIGGFIQRTLAVRAPIPSQSIYLTLDRRLQEATQNALKEAIQDSVWGPYARGGAAVVMDVHTGEILAIASYPDFNVDAFNPYTSLPDAAALIQQWKDDPLQPTYNRATLGQFPPASVFKIVSFTAAADSGEFALTTPIVCGGVWNGASLGDRLRKDWLAGGHGRVTLQQALTGSCNIYFWNVGAKLNSVDPELLIRYARKYGLGQPTGIIGVNEGSGLLPDPATHEQRYGVPWRISDALNTVIGQGDVQVTPLQIVRMVAAVANGGTLYQPLIVKQVGFNTPIWTAKPTPNGVVNVDPEVLVGLREAMCGVTQNPNLGTAYFVYHDLKGVTVCGKTGTAENTSQDDRTTAWFVAFAGRTADKPEIAVAVVVDRGGEGSWIASPIVRRIIESYFDLPLTNWPAWYGDISQIAAGSE